MQGEGRLPGRSMLLPACSHRRCRRIEPSSLPLPGSKPRSSVGSCPWASACVACLSCVQCSVYSVLRA